MNYNSKEYINKIAESKLAYHRKQCKLPYEEKIGIIIELQKVEMEMIKSNKSRSSSNKYRRLWDIDLEKS